MAVFHCVEQLEENILDEIIVPKIAGIMQNLCGEIIVRCIVHDDVDVGTLLYHAVERDDARVGRGELVQSNFRNVDLLLVGSPMPWGNEVFCCVGLLASMVAGVNRTINDAVASNAQNFGEFEGSSINECSDRWIDGVEGRRNIRRQDVLQRGFCSLGVYPVGSFSIICKVAKRITLVRFGLSLSLATLTYKALIPILG